MTHDVTAATFEADVLASDEPVIVDFWAPWCGPCHAISPLLDRIAEERRGELRVVKVNVDQERELAFRYGVSGIPTVVLFEHGEPAAVAVGARSQKQLEKSLGLTPQAA